MKIKYLFSGIDVENGFNDKIVPFLQSDIKGGKIVFIPTVFIDNDKNQQFSDLYLKIFSNIGISFNNAIIINSKMNKERAKEEVETADVIFLMGGNTEAQIKNIKEYGLIPSLQKRDGVTIGISAGSINMSDNVILVRYDKETLLYKGIGLVDINVDPHFSFEDKEYIQNNLLPASYGKKLICLTDESIIRISETNEIMYFGNCYEIKDGNIRLINSNMDQSLKIKEKISSCEVAYINCFSECYENNQIMRYRDSQLNDMYDHNFTYIKKALSIDALQKIIKDEINLNQQENKDFFKITMDEMPDVKCLEGYNGKMEIGHYGQYVYMPMKSPDWNTLNGYVIRKIADSSMVEDLVSLDLIHDSESCGEDFCYRRARRRGRVYLSEIPLESYICYYNGMPVGNCDLFLYERIANIEDFAVLPEYQRHGIGTTILKFMIDTALSKGAETIYLTADEDDTPKEMYKKLGFEKAGDSYELFLKL